MKIRNWLLDPVNKISILVVNKIFLLPEDEISSELISFLDNKKTNLNQCQV
jgi:hypothetical protein